MMSSTKQVVLILIHFILMAIIMVLIFQEDNKALEAPLLAISIFLELSLFSCFNKIIK